MRTYLYICEMFDKELCKRNEPCEIICEPWEIFHRCPERNIKLEWVGKIYPDEWLISDNYDENRMGTTD